MTTVKKQLISVVIPLYNEVEGIGFFHNSLLAVLDNLPAYIYEVIYCDDGSTDGTSELIKKWCQNNPNIKLLSLSRNFGKENTLTAGIAMSAGNAIITLDGDGQHPVEMIPKFIDAWRQGSKVVVGLRTNSSGGGSFKRVGTRLFYSLFNRTTNHKLIPGSTDFRLIDHYVQQEFLLLKESDRITRGLIDWLGFNPKYIAFTSKERQQGSAGYSHKMLIKLALNSVVSMSSIPLYLFGYLGLFITTAAFVLGAVVAIEQLILGDPWHWKFTGTAMLSILLLFLVGLLLLSQGLLSLYVAHIHNQSKQRPLYIIDYENSVGIDRTPHA